MPNETPEKINPNQSAGDLQSFKRYVDARLGAIRNVAASHLNPERLARIVIANVSRTPNLKECTIASIFRATLQAAELGLEPGSAIGSAYLVPYGKECTLIVGYRGLIDLAFRSGQIKSIKANVVYQGDTFEYEEGLIPRLRHVPDFTADRKDADITFAYVVIQLKDGGVLFDVMTRGEIDRIRGRSKSGRSGPWVTDFAEMAKKTVARRGLKYAPMSIELKKAVAMDARDHGEQITDAEFLDLADEPEEAESKADRIAKKLPVLTPEGEVYDGPTVSGSDEQAGML